MLFLPQMAAFVKEAGKKRKKFLSKTQALGKWAGKVREIFLSIIIFLGKEFHYFRKLNENPRLFNFRDESEPLIISNTISR